MKHRIEIFSAGCALCNQTIDLVRTVVGAENAVVVHDMRQADNVQRAHGYGVRQVPAVVIDGQLTSCCTGSGSDEQILRDAVR